MELTKNISHENVAFPHEGSIISDIASEAANKSENESLTDDQLAEKIKTVLKQKIEDNVKGAHFLLGQFYFEQGEYADARTYFEQCKDSDFQALYQLGVIYYDGLGCEPNPKLGIEYLMKVAASDSKQAAHLVHSAQYHIGRAYFQGYGMNRQSDLDAERWWVLAADDGNPNASVKAQMALGMYYSRPDSLSLKKAFFWHSEACGNGNLESQGALGAMYANGVGCKKDSDAAYTCLKEASDRGSVYAMGNLVAHYYRRKLYTKSADLASRVSQLSDPEELAANTDCIVDYVIKGLAMACFYYARCLQNGHGLKKDPAEAKTYYSKSYSFDPDVCANLQNITQHGVI